MENKTDLNEMLLKYAESDLNLARKHRSIMVCQTKKGTLDLNYDGSEYALSGVEIINGGRIDRWEIKGPKRVIRKALANLYDVREVA